jgi:hypothetical protein
MLQQAFDDDEPRWREERNRGRVLYQLERRELRAIEDDGIALEHAVGRLEAGPDLVEGAADEERVAVQKIDHNESVAAGRLGW